MVRRVRSNRAFPLLLVAGVLLLAGLACSGFDFSFGGETEPPPTRPPATLAPVVPPPPVTQPPQGNEAFLTVDNQSAEPVCFMRISPTTSPEWGEDWLGADILDVGSSYTFGPMAAGTYDLRAEFCGGDSVEEFGYNITGNANWIVSGAVSDTGPGPMAAGEIQLLVINQTTETVCFMRISPVTSQYWGDDWLGADVIEAGAEYAFFVEAGMYDLRAEFCGGTEPIEYYQADLTSDGTWTLGPE